MHVRWAASTERQSLDQASFNLVRIYEPPNTCGIVPGTLNQPNTDTMIIFEYFQLSHLEGDMTS